MCLAADCDSEGVNPGKSRSRSALLMEFAYSLISAMK